MSRHARAYHAPVIFVGIFYGILLTWTVVSLVFLWPKARQGTLSIAQILMIAFVLAYTWYFSLGISYRIRIQDDGHVEMASIRRILAIPLKDISMVEGPRLAFLPYSFLRFRLEREKAYLFCRITDENLAEILGFMRNGNRDITFKGL
jgi:hypothetical protein